MHKPNLFPASALFVYVLKCLIGFSMGYALYLYFPRHQFYWSIITVLLVIAPDDADANRLALERIKANFIGAGAGLLASLFHKPAFILICAGVVLTILNCYFLKLINVTRSALAALVIVMINKNQFDPRYTALERMGCVLIGCLIGLVITFIFNMKPKKQVLNSDPTKVR